MTVFAMSFDISNYNNPSMNIKFKGDDKSSHNIKLTSGIDSTFFGIDYPFNNN